MNGIYCLTDHLRCTSFMNYSSNQNFDQMASDQKEATFRAEERTKGEVLDSSSSTEDIEVDKEPRLEPDFVTAGNQLLLQGRNKDAIRAYSKHLVTHPNDSAVLHHKGMALRHLGKYEEALEALNASLKGGETSLVWNHIGEVFHRLGRIQEAITAYDKALALGFDGNNHQCAHCYHNKGVAVLAFAFVLDRERLRNLIKIKKCNKKTRKERAHDPECQDAEREALNSSDIRTELINQALSCFDKAIELDPKFSVSYIAKGLILFLQNRSENLPRFFEEAMHADVLSVSGKNMSFASLISSASKYLSSAEDVQRSPKEFLKFLLSSCMKVAMECGEWKIDVSRIKINEDQYLGEGTTAQVYLGRFCLLVHPHKKVSLMERRKWQ